MTPLHRRPRPQHEQGPRATTQRVPRAGRKYRREMATRLGTRCHVLQKDVPHARAEVQLVVEGGRRATATDDERVRGAELVGVRVNVARMQAAAPPLLPSPTHSASSAVMSLPPSPESPETVQQEGRRSQAGPEGQGHGRDRGGRAKGRTSGSKGRGDRGGSGGSWREGGGAGVAPGKRGQGRTRSTWRRATGWEDRWSSTS